MAKVLLLGETWFVAAQQMVGLETLHSTDYTDNSHYLRSVLERAGHEVVHIPNHLAPDEAPATVAQFAEYDVVVLSDISARTLQLPRAVRIESRAVATDRLSELAAWVRGGGGLLMVGGYCSFGGANGVAQYAGTPVADVLPVEILSGEDRRELPGGAIPEPGAAHDIYAGAPAWSQPLLGYNRLTARAGSTSVLRLAGDPLLVLGDAGSGRTAAFASDCAPHWCPPATTAAPAYALVFANLVTWLAKHAIDTAH
jgi:uncharacterized membrane protein